MKATVSFTLNHTTYSFDIDKGDDMAVMNQAIVMGNPPRFCKQASSKATYKLETNKDKEGNVYVNMVCYSEDGKIYKAKLGSYKDKSGFFWHDWVLDEFAMKRIQASKEEYSEDIDV